MSVLPCILAHFTTPLAICSVEANLETIFKIVRSTPYPIVAVVNKAQFPIGVIDCNRLLWFVLQKKERVHKVRSQQEQEHWTNLDRVTVRDFQLTKWVEAVETIPVNLNLEQILAYFQTKKINQSEQKNYLTIDATGKLLGKLDTFRLSQWLLSSSINFEGRSSQKPTPKIDWHLPIFQFIEQIPLPLMLQTARGITLYQNQVWRQQIDSDRISNPLEIDQFIQSLNYDFSLVYSVAESQESTPYCVKGNYYQSDSFADSSPRKITGKSQQILDKVIERQTSTFSPNKKRQRSTLSSVELESIPLPERKSEWQYLKLPFRWVNNGSNLTESEIPAWVTVALKTKPIERQNQEPSPNNELLKLNQLKDKFLTNISHELKSPLTAIIGLSSLLKEEKLGNLNQRQIRYSELIYRSGKQLMKIVSDILELTHLATGKLQLNFEVIQIKSFCLETYQQVINRLEESEQISGNRLLSRKSDARGGGFNNQIDRLDITDLKSSETPLPPPRRFPPHWVAHQDTTETARTVGQSFLKPQFKLSIAQNLDLIVADKIRLRQILVYLLDNALNFVRWKKSYLSTSPAQITIAVDDWHDWIAISIIDDGIGIPEEIQNLILEQYFSLGTYQERRYNDIALGLTMAQQLAKAHGGNISFVSSCGRGSKFTVLLPSQSTKITSDRTSYPNSLNFLRQSLELNYEDRHPKSNSQDDQSEFQQNLLILIIDTVAVEIERLDLQLKELGYYPIVARTISEAQQKARQFKPSKIILNPHFSASTDDNIIMGLKADPLIDEIPLFVLLDRQQDRQKYALADGFLLLPIEQKSLSKIIPSVKAKISKSQKSLTILHLYPESEITSNLKIIQNSDLSFALNEHLSGLNHRVLEADSLEQGELLARIWQIDAIVLDGRILQEPLRYLRSLKRSERLSSLPLVTLDIKTTEAANQIEGLAVFPCLLPEEKSNLANLVQVIQIAAGIKNNRSTISKE